MANKQIPVRLPEETYALLASMAEQENTSMNALVVESVMKSLREREYKALYDSFTLLGKDSESDVEFGFAAQREVTESAG